jgi:hypothetical protein
MGLSPLRSGKLPAARAPSVNSTLAKLIQAPPLRTLRLSAIRPAAIQLAATRLAAFA